MRGREWSEVGGKVMREVRRGRGDKERVRKERHANYHKTFLGFPRNNHSGGDDAKEGDGDGEGQDEDNDDGSDDDFTCNDTEDHPNIYTIKVRKWCIDLMSRRKTCLRPGRPLSAPLGQPHKAFTSFSLLSP